MIQNTYMFYLDVSGTLKSGTDDIYVGCILFNENYRAGFREKFYAAFPSLRSFEKKGASLHPDKLKEIIKFMDDNHIKMSCCRLPRHIIKKYYGVVAEQIQTTKNLHVAGIPKDYDERIIAIAYYTALKQYAHERCSYACTFCVESQFNLQSVFVALSRISHSGNFYFRPSHTYRRVEHMLKFADFVASAGRKIDTFVLNQFVNFKIVDCAPTSQEIDVVFDISRHKNPCRNYLN